MKLFNKGKRTIGTTKGNLKSGFVIELSDVEAQRLLDMYPNELDITGATVEEVKEKDVELADLQAKLDAALIRIDEIKAENEVKDETIADLQAKLDAVKGKPKK